MGTSSPSSQVPKVSPGASPRPRRPPAPAADVSCSLQRGPGAVGLTPAPKRGGQASAHCSFCSVASRGPSSRVPSPAGPGPPLLLSQWPPLALLQAHRPGAAAHALPSPGFCPDGLTGWVVWGGCSGVRGQIFILFFCGSNSAGSDAKGSQRSWREM